MSLSAVVRRAVTALAVVAALIPLAWFAFSMVTGATLITFRTGSMSPTMPQGSVAVSVPIDAAEIAVDDIVTVQRAGEPLPVTHRVVSVSAVPDAPEARELVLKGDANDTVDAQPYVVAEARQAVVALPGVGSALMLLQSPVGMTLLIGAAGALTVWAFWPSKTRQKDG